MSILTKEERSDLREFIYHNDGDPDWEVVRLGDMARALDTIDALEAERDEAQDIIRGCYEILEDAGLSAEDPDGCGLPGIVCDMARALNALPGGLE